MKIDKILVPVDFSEFSDRAVEYAAFLARNFCAEITLLHVVVLFRDDFNDEEQLQVYHDLARSKEKEKQEKMEVRCNRIREQGLTIHSDMSRGFSEADSILDYLSDHAFDLVVMGTHGRRGIKKMILGSVTEKVVRKSPLPVITLHKDYRINRLKRILVPVDFSDQSRGTVAMGKLFSARFQTGMDFLHVVEAKDHPEFYSVSFESILKANPSLKDHIVKNMKELTGSVPAGARHHVREGKVYREIIDHVKENDIDLVVMATNTVHELDEILMGSNSERVLRIAPCPVLTMMRQ